MRRFKGYIADHNGRTTGKDDRPIAYTKGELIPAEKGELDHVGMGMVPVYEDGGVSSGPPEVQTASLDMSETETRPVKPAPRKRTPRKKASTAQK